ncbi:glycosyltransferase [Vibrio cyclitrophicus]
MKICHVTYLRFKDGNGITNAVVNLCQKENESERVDVSKILSIDDFLPNENNDLYTIFTRLNMLLNPDSNVFNIIKHLIKFKPDIVNFHVIYKPLTMLLAFICCLLNIKYVVTPHSSLMYEAQKKNKRIKTIYNTLFLKRMLSKSSLVYFLNHSELDNSEKMVDRLKYRILPNGVEQRARQQRVRNSTGLKILFLARYDVHHKGIDILLSYIESKMDFFERNNISLDMYGSGDASSIQCIVDEKEINGFVNVNGTVFGESKENAFKSADVYILTSRYEGLPISVLEALSYGLPCLLSKHCNMQESTAYGCSFQIDNSENLLDSLNLLINSDDFHNASIKAFNYIDEKFNWDKIVSSRIDDFEKVNT